MDTRLVLKSINTLQEEYPTLNWTYQEPVPGNPQEKKYQWPGKPSESIMICVHKSDGKQKFLHRHDYFYFMYNYQGQADLVSSQYNNIVTLHENELYAGQPYAGHAICAHDNQKTIIISVMIQKDVFFRSFVPMLSSNIWLMRFFLTPSVNQFSDEFIHFKPSESSVLVSLLEIMVVVYANRDSHTQDMLKSLVLAFLIEVSKQYTALVRPKKNSDTLFEEIVHYIGEHYDSVTLKSLSDHFSYHPNYISTLLTKELGKSFSQILLEQRMERAVILLKGTNLSLLEISEMLGYSSSSNFYKAFKKYYGISPREYAAAQNEQNI